MPSSLDWKYIHSQTELVWMILCMYCICPDDVFLSLFILFRSRGELLFAAEVSPDRETQNVCRQHQPADPPAPPPPAPGELITQHLPSFIWNDFSFKSNSILTLSVWISEFTRRPKDQHANRLSNRCSFTWINPPNRDWSLFSFT